MREGAAFEASQGGPDSDDSLVIKAQGSFMVASQHPHQRMVTAE